jgi:hypothetical protein
MSDAEPDITNESTSDGTAGAQTRGMNDSSVGPQLFVDFEKLNISEGRPEKKGRHEDSPTRRHSRVWRHREKSVLHFSGWSRPGPQARVSKNKGV